jgi:hypothetical protein
MCAVQVDHLLVLGSSLMAEIEAVKSKVSFRRSLGVGRRMEGGRSPGIMVLGVHRDFPRFENEVG